VTDNLMAETFATELARRRVRLGLTQDGLAHALGIPAYAVGVYERGASVPRRARRRAIRARISEMEAAHAAEILAELAASGWCSEVDA